MGYRINERNTGDYLLDGDRKKRAVKRKKISDEEKEVVKQVIIKVYECMEFDKGVGFTDGGRFTLCLSRDQMKKLWDAAQKM